jgi:carboxylesterase
MYRKEELIKPFFFQGGEIGILLIHGFTACPIDMKPLGEKLNSFGYTVYAPLLAGHGLTPEDLKTTSWKDWERSAAEALGQLKGTCRKIIAIGHSMGGLIALSLAAQGKLDAIVSINAPIIYKERDYHFADRLLGKQEYVEKPGKQEEITVNSEGLPHFSYVKVPVECFVSLNKALTPIQNELRKIGCPALIVQSLEDKTVHPRSGRMIEKSIKHRRKDVIYWAKEDHYLPLSSQRNKLAEKIRIFLLKYNF